jgi:hypothetical protein
LPCGYIWSGRSFLVAFAVRKVNRLPRYGAEGSAWMLLIRFSHVNVVEALPVEGGEKPFYEKPFLWS